MTKFLSLAILLAASAVGTPAEADQLTQLKSAMVQFRDIQFVAEVVQKDKKVLNTIDERLAMRYEFSKAKVWFKTPHNTKIDGTLGMVKAQYTTTDTISILRIPGIRYSKKEDISDDPTKKQSALDLGLLTSQMFSDYQVTVQPEDERRPGLWVLQLRLPDKSNASVRTIWVDPVRVRVVRMEKRRPSGRLVGAFVYLDYDKYGALWVPRRVELYSNQDKLAATLQLREIQVDSNIPDSVFQ